MHELAIRDANVRRDFITNEIVRKSIHLLSAFVPTIASYSRTVALALLAAGAIVYSLSEYFRLSGRSTGFINSVTVFAARPSEASNFVLGPVTLALGCMLALLFYPSPASAIAIYALAFGDGFASLVGRLVGRTPIPGIRGKTVEGSLACFLASALAAWELTKNTGISISCAVVAAAIELVPLKDLDNVLLPLAVGFYASLSLGIV